MQTSHSKILFFVTEDWFVCSHWLPLIESAKNAGFQVVVVTRTNKHAERILQHGVRLIPFEISRRGSNVFREFNTILRLMEIYRKERPDIVHHAKGKVFNISNDCFLEEMVDGIASALGVARPWLRLPESPVRIATHVISKFTRIPLTQERINALVSRTRYPCLKLEQELGFSPRISVPETIGEVVLAQ